MTPTGIASNDTHVFPRFLDLYYPSVERGDGVWLTTTDGRRILDACSGGAMVACLGHGVPEIVDAAAEQAERVAYFYNHHFTSEPQERLADRVLEVVAPGMARVRLVSGGSEANETALQLARLYHVERGDTARWRVISQAQSYHGSTMGTLALTGRSAIKETYAPYLASHLHIPPSTWRFDPSGQAALDELDRHLAEHGPEVAAFLCEPISAAALPAYSPPDAFWEGLTGLQFLMALLRLTGFDDAECKRRADHALEQVALTEARDRKIGGYSKGMRQRIKMAQSLAHDPQVLLLDEPLSGMDPVNRRRVVDLVKKLGREGRTVLVSSHILHEVEAMTRRVLLIHNGRILAEGDVREIRDLMDEHPHTVALRARDPRALARAVVGSPHVLSLTFGAEGEWVTVQTARPDEFYSSVVDAAVEAGVSEMYSPDENLESVFKYLVAR